MNRKLDKNELLYAIQNIKIKGFCKIDNFLNKNYVDFFLKKVQENYNNFYKGKSLNGVPDRDVSDKIIYNLHNIDHNFVELISSDTMNYIGMYFLNDEYYRFLDKDKPNYNLTYYNARSGGSKLDLHIDSGIPYKGKEVLMMQFVFLLEDSNESNGCTVVVPGSHQSGEYTDRTLDFKQLEKLEGKKGDLFIWDSRLWHGAMENINKISRWAIIATMSRWWIKPSMDIVRSIEPDIYDKCTNMQKQLLGFCSIPPVNPFERVNTKNGYSFLKNNVNDYFKN